MDPLSTPSHLSSSSAEISSHEHIVAENTSAEGNFSGSAIHSTTSSQEAGKIKEGALDRILQTIGDPVKTITAIATHFQSRSERRERLEKLEIEKGAFVQLYDAYATRGLEEEFCALIAAYDHALDSNLSSESEEALHDCKQKTETLFDEAVQVSRARRDLEEITTKKNSHVHLRDEYVRYGLQAEFEKLMECYDRILATPKISEEMHEELKASEEALTIPYNIAAQAEATRRAQARAALAPNASGAFKISASAAARAGIFEEATARRAPQEPEANEISIARPISDAIAGQIAKSSRQPNGSPVVDAELPETVTLEIPPNQVFNADLLKNLKASASEA